MLAKLLMCSFYSELLESNENNESVKKLTHFYFKCEDKHEYFVHKCRGHTFMYPRLHDMTYKCDCKDIEPFDTCDFRCYKFCVEKIPNALTSFLVPVDNYLEHETTKCKSFFILNTTKLWKFR